MSKYTAPLADMRFVLYDVLEVEKLYAQLPGCDTATRDVLDAVLEEGARQLLQKETLTEAEIAVIAATLKRAA